MNQEEQKWVEGILHSTKGSHKASPPENLYQKISESLFEHQAAIIKISQWKWIAAAAVVVLVLNATQIYNQVGLSDQIETISGNSPYSELVSSYNFYQ